MTFFAFNTLQMIITATIAPTVTPLDAFKSISGRLNGTACWSQFWIVGDRFRLPENNVDIFSATFPNTVNIILWTRHIFLWIAT